MDIVSLVSDFWQIRCNRICKNTEIDEDVKAFNTIFWLSFIENTHKIIFASDADQKLEIDVLSTVQWPLIKYAFYDVQFVPESTRYVQKLRITSANLRSALAKSKADKVVSNACVNILELTLSEVGRLCQQIVSWLDQDDKIYLSLFSPVTHIIRNWIHGVYGNKPTGENRSLQLIRDSMKDKRRVICECANSLKSILIKTYGLKSNPSIGVIGSGSWVNRVAAELRRHSSYCYQYERLRPEMSEDILFLLLPENSVTPVVAKHLSCNFLIELIPGQINPDSDAILTNRNITVIPDIVCSSALEIVEDWWLSGMTIPDWPLALFNKLTEVWSEIISRRELSGLSFHDTAYLLALERLTERWNS